MDDYFDNDFNDHYYNNRYNDVDSEKWYRWKGPRTKKFSRRRY